MKDFKSSGVDGITPELLLETHLRSLYNGLNVSLKEVFLLSNGKKLTLFYWYIFNVEGFFFELP